ncbi:hypothetical protein TEA_029148 [Camellia sinensis var. sinensis]|uniref:Uncharacterized protein n=1 Tax=Camellia sinensis var. sinensis TaxID=542762 RepID=A0A4S4EAV9_CAMSN|nr:hypothetical protein TEA_029148 [Camellia sinensis var. sinensis]
MEKVKNAMDVENSVLGTLDGRYSRSSHDIDFDDEIQEIVKLFLFNFMYGRYSRSSHDIDFDDEIQGLNIGPDDVWDAYTKENPDGTSFRTKTMPNYNDLCLVYGNLTSEGRWNQSDPYVGFNGDVAYILHNQERPDAQPFRSRTLPNYNDLFLIYGNTSTNGRSDHASHCTNLDDGALKVNICELSLSPCLICVNHSCCLYIGEP